MKITFLLLFITITSVLAKAQKTELSLNVTNEPIANILEKIEKETNYNFYYNSELIDVEKKVSARFRNEDILAILDQVLVKNGIAYQVVGEDIILKNSNASPNKETKRITGRIVDQQNEPLTGVNIRVEGTQTGTITDIDGNFQLSASVGSVLSISYIGYLNEKVTVGTQNQLLIRLREDHQALDEVVVIGYGVVKKSDLTGSVTRVSAEGLNNLPVTSIDQALQGRAAGVQITNINGAPGSGTRVLIRGGNSINADNEPLYVIDGFIGGGDLSTLSPADIESIEVLKDATATAIYGSRGANGVIMITTKRGKEGSNKVNVSFYQGIQKVGRKLDLMDGPERAAYANAYAEYNNSALPFPDLSQVTHTDWQDAVMRIGTVTNADISFSGGNNDFQHYISGNFYNQEGIFKSSGFTRYQMRVNLDKKVFKWMKIGLQTNASYTNNDKPKFGSAAYIENASTTSPVYDEEGNYNYINPLSGREFNNPVANINLKEDNTYKNRLLTNFYVELYPIKNMIIRSTLGGNFSNTKDEMYEPGALPIRQSAGVGGKAIVEDKSNFSLLNENTINYLFNINKHHNFSILGGMTVQKDVTKSHKTEVEGFTNDLMGFNNLGAGDPETVKYESGYTKVQMISFLGRLNYSLYNKYLLTVTARMDGSSRLAENNKWAFFPSAAIAWRMSEENFIRDLELFHNLKLRLSYGTIGNQAIKPYQSLASLNMEYPTIGGKKQLGYKLGNLPNPNLKWETTSQADLGLEAAFLKGRLSFELDLYYKRTKDLLLEVEIPWTSGYEKQLRNVGEVENKGIEFMVNANIIQKKDWSWDLYMNISKNKNKVLDIGNIEYRELENGVHLIKGQPAGVFVGAVYEGTWKSQAEIDANPDFMPGAKPGSARFKDVNENGTYDGLQDYEVLGSAEPKFHGGFGSNLRYKRVDLSLFFQGSYGNKILNTRGTHFFFGSFGNNLFSYKGKEQPWSESNPTSDVPAAGAFANNIDVNNITYSTSVQDGSYLKLKTLKIGYTLSSEKIKWMNSCNVYLLCENLFTITNYTYGYDPDVTGGGNEKVVVRGRDDMSYPHSRTFQIGFNVEF